MNLSDFDYDLPPELIAREPVRPRDASRMMVLDRRTGQYTDSAFRKLSVPPIRLSLMIPA